MSTEIYELASLTMRYVFVALGVVIVLRAWYSIAQDNALSQRIRQSTRMAGCVAELVVVRGAGDIAPGMRYPMYEECRIGASGRNDVVIKHKSIKSKHAYIEKRGSEYIVTSLNLLSPVKRPRGLKGAQLIVKNGDNIVIGDFTFKLIDYDAQQQVMKVKTGSQVRITRTIKPKKAVIDERDEWEDW